MENLNSIKTARRQDRHGANNPMWGRKHTAATRAKMSQKAQTRAAEYKQYQQQKEAQQTPFESFLNTHPLMKEYFTTIIREEIEKLWRNGK